MMKIAESSFIDPTATVEDGTKIWHHSVILAKVHIGKNCSIGSCVEIGHGSKIGHESRIGFGTFLPSNSIVGERVFIGPGVTFCDDKFPRVNNPNYNAQPPVIENDASVGAGSTILPGIHIGKRALIGAGSVVTHDVPDDTVVKGEPARVYVKAVTE